MGNREFEEWALKQEMSIAPSVFRGSTFDNKVTEGALLGRQARQPEIDALKEKVAAGVASIKGYAAENAALKVKVERLRERIEPASLFLLSIASAHSVSPFFRKIAQGHHNALDAAMKETK